MSVNRVHREHYGVSDSDYAAYDESTNPSNGWRAPEAELTAEEIDAAYDAACPCMPEINAALARRR